MKAGHIAIRCIGLLCAGSAVAQVSSGSPGGETLEQATMHAVGIALLGIAMPAIGWLLSRSIAQVDKKFDKIEGKLDAVLSAFAGQTADLAVVKIDHENTKREVDSLREWRQSKRG